MVDQAHPEPVIIAPSYDRLNGLVENVKERQNIMIGIINKPQQAKLTQHRYVGALNELNQELVRLGFQMDNKDEDELRILADSCSMQIHKNAGFPFIPVIAIAGGLLLLGLYNNYAYISQGVINDCDNAIEALQKYGLAVPTADREVDDLISAIEYVKTLNQNAIEAAERFKAMPQSSNVVQTAANLFDSPEGQKTIKTIETYKHVALKLADKIVKIYVPLIQTTEPGEERSSSSIWAGMKSLWNMVAGSPKNDVLKVLVGPNVEMIGEGGLVGSLRKSVQSLSAQLNALRAYVSQNQQTLTQYLKTEADKPTTTPSEAPSEAPSAAPSATPQSTPKSEPKKSLLDELKLPF